MPGCCGLLLLAPQKTIAPQAACTVCSNDFFKASQTGGCFDPTRWLFLRTPCCLGRFKRTVDTPLRDEVRFLPSKSSNVQGQLFDAPVSVDPKHIDIGAVGSDHVDFGRIDAGKHRGGGMMGIHLVNELGQGLHGIPNTGVGVLQIHLIPDSPKQQCRVVFVFQDFLLELGQLTFHSMHVVVIHARPLRPQIQPQHDRHPAGMRRIQKG